MQESTRVNVWVDGVNLVGERTWRLYETNVIAGSYESLGFFRVREGSHISYYQDPLSYVQHRADMGVHVELLSVDLETWRARRRTYQLKRLLPEDSEESC